MTPLPHVWTMSPFFTVFFIGELPLIKLSIFSWTAGSSKRRRIKLEDVMDIDHGKNYLNRERISHKCNQCEYITSFRRGSLRGHLKTHSGEKLNKCNQCDYASTQANTLRAHVNTHSGEKSNKLQPMYVCILLSGTNGYPIPDPNLKYLSIPDPYPIYFQNHRVYRVSGITENHVF